ncbi:hypothetical protein ACO0LD_26530 [Undibacterium sp. Ji83W]|uniref:hypothetical protein n=1 Tax=Undibacterium sp. Ji83W TaxID=3413043 RepID=UPI003BF08C67
MNKPINLFSWLFDVALDPQAIRFVLFELWTFRSLKIEDIKSVTEVGWKPDGMQNGANAKTHFLARSFLIETRLGWLDRKMVVTPKDPEAFLAWAKLNKLYIPTN